MEHKLEYRFASFLYKYSFPIYRNLYNRFKQRQDATELSLLKYVIKKGDVILDIGSNIGFYSKIMSDLTGETGKVHCFEPDKTNFKHLQKFLKEKSNVILVNKAVSDTTGRVEIFTSHRINVDHRTYKPEKYRSSYFIDSIAMDDYLSENIHIDFIKMDIQGAELFALKGMTRTLSKNKNLKIVMEFWPHGLQNAGTSAAELLDFMYNFGFYAYLIDKNRQEINSKNINTLSSSEHDYYNLIFTA